MTKRRRPLGAAGAVLSGARRYWSDGSCVRIA